MTHDENLATSADRAGLAGSADHLTQLADALSPIFSRSDLRSNAMAYVRALLMPGVSGNCWALATPMPLPRASGRPSSSR